MKNWLVQLSIVLSVNGVYAQTQDDKTLEDAKKQVTNAVSEVGTGASSFWSGMKESFGFLDSSYVYSFIVWNDTPGGILVLSEGKTKVLGAEFAGNIDNALPLGPAENSGSKFNNQQLYLKVWIVGDKTTLNWFDKKTVVDYQARAAKFDSIGSASDFGDALGGILGAPFENFFGAVASPISGAVLEAKLAKNKIYARDIPKGLPNDKNIYHYRAYTSEGVVNGEYLGVKKTTTEFAGVFYNKTDQAITLKFTKDDIDWSVLLEANSFNLLSSTQGNPISIRPASGTTRAFQWYHSNALIGYIPIANTGIANVVENPQTKALEISGPMTTTYEIFIDANKQFKVGTQGMAVGNYDQPVSKRIRDINPAVCTVWYPSPDQITQAQTDQAEALSYDTVPIAYSGDVWAVYKTADQTIMQKLPLGQVTKFFLLRPRLSEQSSWLYFVLVDAVSDVVATQFLTRLITNNLARSSVYTTIEPNFAKNDATGWTNIEIKPNLNGLIDDRNISGARGYILLADQFTSHGVGTGPFYYKLALPKLMVSQLASQIPFAQSLYTTDAQGRQVLQPDLLKQFADNVVLWIGNYVSNPSGTQRALENYVKQNGSEQLFVSSQVASGSRTFTSQAMQLIKELVMGEVSIAKPPLIIQAGTSYYPFTQGVTPTDWPE